MTRLAEELGKLPNHLLIEGHTDAKPFAVKDGNYTNWELSTDRGNAARRLMEAHGIRHEQVGQVRGFADRQLRHPEDPEHASNRRISVIVQYLTPPPEPAKAAGEEKKAGEADEGSERSARLGQQKSPWRGAKDLRRISNVGKATTTLPAAEGETRRTPRVASVVLPSEFLSIAVIIHL